MKHWFNDGKIQKYCDVCPDGFKPGRINKKLNATEQKNKELINVFLQSICKKDFKDFYRTHSVKETLEKYKQIPNAYILKKILIELNYDFSNPKPSLFKGKSAARTHASYVEAGKKSAETQRAKWEGKTVEEKQAWSKLQQAAHTTNSFKTAISNINKEYWASLDSEKKKEILQKRSNSNAMSWKNNRTEILSKQYNTRVHNKSFNTSMPEDKFYIALLSKFSETDIIRQYTDERYPYKCDFYIQPLDLFIELNLSWVHGGRKYVQTDVSCVKQLETWREKAKTSDYYKKAIDTWTRLDVNKFMFAKKHNLNYKAFYTEVDAYTFLQTLE